MIRRWHSGSALPGIVVLAASHVLALACTAAFAQESSQDTKAALMERDRLRDQAQKLHTAGKLSEAIAAAEAMLAIERKVLPADHADLAVSLDWLAGLYLAREDFAAARAARNLHASRGATPGPGATGEGSGG